MFALFCALSVFASDYTAKSGFVELSPEPSVCGVSAVQTERCDADAVFHDVRILSDGSRDRALVVRFLLPQDKPCDFLHTHYPRVPVPIKSRDCDYPAHLSWGSKDIGSSKRISTVPLLGSSSDGAEKEMASVDGKGEYVQPKEYEMIFFRMLAGKKPYCMFQNSNFNLLTYEMSERYIQRMLAYGILPSYFSPVHCGTSTRFFAHPAWREGVRPLFKKYFKTLKAVSEAGWEPVSRTLRSAKPDDVTVEQFGTPHSPKGCYLTVHNPSGRPAQTTLVPVHGFPAAAEYADLISGVKVPVGSSIILPPYATLTIDLTFVPPMESREGGFSRHNPCHECVKNDETSATSPAMAKSTSSGTTSR